MNIALVILHADAARGGAERYTLDLARALAARGHDVTLIAATIGRVPPDVRTAQISCRRPTRTWQYRAFLRGVEKHLALHEYDIVHAMLPIRRCDVYHPHAGMAASADQQTPWIEKPFTPRRRVMARVEQKLLAGPHPPVVLSLAEYVKQSIIQHYPGLGQRIDVLFNAVDLDHFEPAPRPAQQRVNALFVGQDFDRKGLTTAAQAIDILRDQPIQLTVVGEDTSRYQRPAARDGRIVYSGKTPDTRPYYRNADFLVLPTRHDPCSLVVLEALAMGVPVITTRFNGAAEIMTDGVHGYVLDDPRDPAALAAAMQKMLDPALRARMSAACLELRPKLSYEHHLERLIQIYQRCTVE